MLLREGRFDECVPGPIRWLRDLHSLGVSGDGQPLTDAFDAEARRKFAQKADWIGRDWEIWRKAAAGISDLPATPVHGDFHPANILCSGKDFKIIDFDGVGSGFALIDLAEFLVGLHIFVVQEMTAEAGRIWPDWRNKTLEWYGRPELVHDPALALAIQYRRLFIAQRIIDKKGIGANTRRMRILRKKLALSPADLHAVVAV